MKEVGFLSLITKNILGIEEVGIYRLSGSTKDILQKVLKKGSNLCKARCIPSIDINIIPVAEDLNRIRKCLRFSI
jgi:hypothetical protein